MDSDCENRNTIVKFCRMQRWEGSSFAKNLGALSRHKYTSLLWDRIYGIGSLAASGSFAVRFRGIVYDGNHGNRSEACCFHACFKPFAGGADHRFQSFGQSSRTDDTSGVELMAVYERIPVLRHAAGIDFFVLYAVILTVQPQNDR